MTTETLTADPQHAALLAVFAGHSQEPYVGIRPRVETPAADACLICKAPGQFPECDRHVIDHDVYLDRCTDV